MHNKALDNALQLNMCGSAVSYLVLLRLLQAADLRWEMNQAQLFSIELMAQFIKDPVEVSAEYTAKDMELLTPKDIKYTLLGFPVVIRKEYPEGWIRLYAGNKLVGQIDNLAIPASFSSHGDWDKHNAEERDKTLKLWEADNL